MSFTPWLAREENLRLLGEAIGAELTLEARESPVGLFSADLVCREASSNRRVLIENQIERTDHAHLGQILTYAAGLQATTVVWVASSFRDEHRAALDWLNEATGEDLAFFGLEIELWRIGSSVAAPKFNVVAKPNEFVERVTEETRRTSSGDVAYVPYWTAFKEFVETNSTVLRPTKPLPQYEMDFSIGRSDIKLRVAAGRRDGYVLADFVILNDPDGSILRRLKSRRETLDEALPGAEWKDKIGFKQSAVEFRTTEFDPTNEEEWPVQHEWLLTALHALHGAFAPTFNAAL